MANADLGRIRVIDRIDLRSLIDRPTPRKRQPIGTGLNRPPTIVLGQTLFFGDFGNFAWTSLKT